MLAQVDIEGKTLHLRDIAIYPKGTQRIDIGARDVLALRQQLADEAKQMGFEKLHITGLRYSGANPGKEVDLWIDLTK